MDRQTEREGQRKTEGNSFKKTGNIIAYDRLTIHLIVQILKI